MSAIAGKAINSTLGTSDYKGLDEAILEGFNNLVTSLTPKFQTIKVELNTNSTETTAQIKKIDANRSKVEVITKIFTEQPTDNDKYFSVHYISPVIASSGEGVTIYHDKGITLKTISLLITTYGG